MLHLFLRITDTLINLLKQEFELIDGFARDINKTILLKRFCDFLQKNAMFQNHIIFQKRITCSN